MRMLAEVLDDGGTVKFLDGSTWRIDPGDIPSVCTWTPAVKIEVVLRDTCATFGYQLINRNIDASAKAARL